MSSNVFFGLSVLFWMAESSQRATASGLPSRPGSLSDWLFDLSEEAQQKGWLDASNQQRVTLSVNLERQIIGRRNPVKNWDEVWDGKWHWLAFDLPRAEQKYRKRLLRFLRHQAFGCIQGSLWVTPFPPVRYAEAIKNLQVPEKSMFLMGGQPEASYKNMDIVSAAWDWEMIYTLHREYLSELNLLRFEDDPAVLATLFKKEAKLWEKVSIADPFLPQSCQPKGYPGQSTWKERTQVLHQWAKRSVKVIERG